MVNSLPQTHPRPSICVPLTSYVRSWSTDSRRPIQDRQSASHSPATCGHGQLTPADPSKTVNLRPTYQLRAVMVN
eukprot:6207032-Pyramimonas_sp.AAC.1